MRVSVSTESAIERVLNRFDFEKVQRVMQHLDWKWNGPPHAVPTVDQLHASAKRLLEELDPTKGFDSRATGGFCAESRRGKAISLTFQLVNVSERIPEPVLETA